VAERSGRWGGFDCVIVGGGLAGLVCGAYLAREGFRVTVLEQAPKTGGFFGSFENEARVQLADGSVVRAPTVVVACDPVQFSPPLPEPGDALPSESVFSVFAAVDLPPGELWPYPVPHCIYSPEPRGAVGDAALTDPEYFHYAAVEISIPCLRDPSLAPPGRTGVILSSLSFMDYREGWDRLSETEYRRRKQETAAALIRSVSRLMPQLDRHLLFTQSASPRTMQAYTLNHGGAFTGWSYRSSYMPSETSFFAMESSIRTSRPGVFRAGHWTFSPSGAPVAMMTGRLAAKAAARALQRHRRPLGR
jgi:phytoene dehydrogenase-like protein